MLTNSLRTTAVPCRITAHRAPRSQYSTTTLECVLERLTGEDQGIAVLHMDRPAAKNAIGKQFITQFRDIIHGVKFDKSVRVLLLRSQVPGVFCAGADLKERATMNPAEVSAFVSTLRGTFTDLSVRLRFRDRRLRVPTIAAINGAALGGGLELALSCDLRVAGTGAKLGLPETKLAIIPGAGGTQRLPRLIGVSKAKELVFTCRVLDQHQAFAYGLVNRAVDGDAVDKAMELAREILPQGPVALQMAKQSIDLGAGVDISTAMEIEIIPTKDRTEGLAAFREKRKPKYIGE